jgi:hypothetical protein
MSAYLLRQAAIRSDRGPVDRFREGRNPIACPFLFNPDEEFGRPSTRDIVE